MRARPPLPSRRILLVGTLLFGASCGRFDYTAYPIEEVTVSSAAGTTLVPGGQTTLTLRAGPGPFVAGAHLHLYFELGYLQLGDTVHDHLEVPIAEDGSMPEVIAIVPVGIEPGRILTVTASDPLSGDVELEVVAPGAEVVTIDGRSYEIPEGLALDAPIEVDPALFAGRGARLALPSEGSAFGDALYVALSSPPGLARDVDGVLTAFFEATDRSGEATRAVAFPQWEKAYGDVVYLCTDGDDGVLAVDAEGGEVEPAVRLACGGLVFDRHKRLDYDVTYSSPLYFNDLDGRIGRADAEGNVEILAEGLAVPEDGLRLIVCPKDFLEANTILLSRGALGMGTDGAAIHLDRLVPLSEPAVWLEGLAEPSDMEFAESAPFGWMAFVALEGADEVVGVRRDGTTISLLRGIAQPSGLLLHDGALWVLGRGGELLRLGVATP